tara:strand:- start:352 stop:939 length:588 start_codon:yes stop_codon:yes gene_type:complete
MMEENNEMGVHFEPADQHISVRITPTEKRMFIKWCRENRLTKSQGIRRLITDRLATPEKKQEATNDITREVEELKKTVREIREQLLSKPKPIARSWTEPLAKVVKEVEPQGDTIKVPAHRLEKKLLLKSEIAVLIGCSVKTLSNISTYVTQDGEPIFINMGKVANKGVFDCSGVHADAFAERFQVDVDWSRLSPE